MRTDQLLARLRRSAWIGDVAAWPDITDTDLLNEMTDRYLALQSEEIITMRAGYGLKDYSQTQTVALTQRYPLPPRCVAGAYLTLEIKDPSSQLFRPISRVEARDVWMYDTGQLQPNMPRYYSVQDDNVELYPAPNQAYTLRFWYYQRPSKLVPQQSSTDNGGVVRGLISSLNKTARTFTVNAVPFDYSLATPAAITTANQTIDIIRASGNYPTVAYSLPQSFTGLNFTIGGTQPLDDVANGDWVRVADQAEWPINLPEEFHRMVADRAAMEVLREIGNLEKLEALAPTVAADMKRFRQACMPQVKAQPRQIPLSPFFARGSRRAFWYP